MENTSAIRQDSKFSNQKYSGHCIEATRIIEIVVAEQPVIRHTPGCFSDLGVGELGTYTPLTREGAKDQCNAPPLGTKKDICKGDSTEGHWKLFLRLTTDTMYHKLSKFNLFKQLKQAKQTNRLK